MEDIEQEIIALVNQIDNARVLNMMKSYLLGITSGLNRK